jgi:protein-L-isoaspartate O-methyltransferase
MDFCKTLCGHLIEEEAFTEVTVVEHIETLIRKARNRLERHERWYSNLFVAYFDLKGAAK